MVVDLSHASMAGRRYTNLSPPMRCRLGFRRCESGRYTASSPPIQILGFTVPTTPSARARCGGLKWRRTSSTPTGVRTQIPPRSATCRRVGGAGSTSLRIVARKRRARILPTSFAAAVSTLGFRSVAARRTSLAMRSLRVRSIRSASCGQNGASQDILRSSSTTRASRAP